MKLYIVIVYALIRDMTDYGHEELQVIGVYHDKAKAREEYAKVYSKMGNTDKIYNEPPTGDESRHILEFSMKPRLRIYFSHGRPFFFKIKDGTLELPFEIYVLNRQGRYKSAELIDSIPLIFKVNSLIKI